MNNKNSFVRIEPFFFGPADDSLFGCNHALESGCYRNCGVILCYPIGYDYITFHRSYRRLADKIAFQGFPALRFDFHGTGDSSGDFERSHIDQWLCDIDDAIHEIKVKFGVKKICLGGLGIGGTLACLYGISRGGIDSMVLLQPVINGNYYLKELTERHNQKHPENLFPEAPKLNESSMKTHIERLGFPLSMELIGDLEKVDLLSSPRKPANKVLFIIKNIHSKQYAFTEKLKKLEVHLNCYLYETETWQNKITDEILVPDRIIKLITTWVQETQS